MVRITPIDAPHLLRPVLEAAFQRVKDKTGERWTPSFVMERLNRGEAKAFRIHDDGAHIAWMVCEIYSQPDPWLNVWIMEGKGLERAAEIVPLIDLVAVTAGCKVWRCTGRRGWKSIGLKPIASVYERVLT